MRSDLNTETTRLDARRQRSRSDDKVTVDHDIQSTTTRNRSVKVGQETIGDTLTTDTKQNTQCAPHYHSTPSSSPSPPSPPPKLPTAHSSPSAPSPHAPTSAAPSTTCKAPASHRPKPPPRNPVSAVIHDSRARITLLWTSATAIAQRPICRRSRRGIRAFVLGRPQAEGGPW